MKLHNEFTVAAPVDQTWSALLDIQRVAECLRGARLDPDDGGGLYRGTMKVRLGAISLEYHGTAQLAEVDYDDRVAAIDVKGKEVRGHGTASATIRNRVVPDGDQSRVFVDTELNITGRPAQFGRGIMEDVATQMLGDFAQRLERMIREPSALNGSARSAISDSSSHEGQAGAGAAFGPATDDGGVLDIGGALAGSVAKRVGIAGTVLLLVLLAWRGRPRPKARGVPVS